MSGSDDELANPTCEHEEDLLEKASIADGMSGLNKDELAEVASSADAASTAPTSKASQAKRGPSKKCGDCCRQVLAEEFKPGNGVCTPCLRIKDNVYNACKSEGEEGRKFYLEQRADPKKWKRLVAYYKQVCPPREDYQRKKHAKFPYLQFFQMVRAEQSMLKDGVLEWMHLCAYQHWASKPKNVPPRGLDAEAAKQEWLKMVDDPEQLVDENGPNPEFRVRVAVKVKDLIIRRSALHNSQGYEIRDTAKKNGQQSDVDKMYTRLHTGMDECGQAGSKLSLQEQASFLARSSTDVAAFDGQAARIGGVRSLRQALEEDSIKVNDVDEEKGKQVPASKDKGALGTKQSTHGFPTFNSNVMNKIPL
eukprot:6486298-Amphidinium_carterae.2